MKKLFSCFSLLVISSFSAELMAQRFAQAYEPREVPNLGKKYKMRKQGRCSESEKEKIAKYAAELMACERKGVRDAGKKIAEKFFKACELSEKGEKTAEKAEVAMKKVTANLEKTGHFSSDDLGPALNAQKIMGESRDEFELATDVLKEARSAAHVAKDKVKDGHDDPLDHLKPAEKILEIIGKIEIKGTTREKMEIDAVAGHKLYKEVKATVETVRKSTKKTDVADSDLIDDSNGSDDDNDIVLNNDDDSNSPGITGEADVDLDWVVPESELMDWVNSANDQPNDPSFVSVGAN